jgi:protein TonB
MAIPSDLKRKYTVLLVSAVLHAALLFLVVFSVQVKTAEIEEAVPISLVNIEVIEEIPETIAEQKEEPRPVVEPEARETSEEIVPVQDIISEIVIETEEEPQVIETPAGSPGPVVETAAASSEPGGTGGVSSGPTALRYLQSNYNYIQRRIMRELVYPSQARRTGLQGVVEIVFTINRDGTVRDAAVRKTCGHPILDEEALRAVQRASPFRKPESPVKIIIPVSFTLT